MNAVVTVACVRLAYLITAYKEPVQLARLTHRLASGGVLDLRYVQLDRSSPIDPSDIAPGTIVETTTRPVNWGDGSYLASMVASFRRMLRHEWEWVVVLSGQDLPVRPIDELRARLAAAQCAGYVPGSDAMPTRESATDEVRGRYWYQYQWAPGVGSGATNGGAKHLSRSVTRLSRGGLRLQRRPLGAGPGLGVRAGWTPFTATRPCHHGSDYFVVRRELVEAMVRFVDAEPRMWNYFQRTYIPTEAFFPSVFRWLEPGAVENDRFHFMRYDGAAHPRLVTPRDHDEVAQSRAFFARKFIDADEWVDEVFPIGSRDRG